MLPCPVCGGEPHIDHNHVYCSKCGCMPAIFDENKDSLNDHKNLWNTRGGNKGVFTELDKVVGKFDSAIARTEGGV